MKYKMIIFDLDGTLCDTLGDLQAACNFSLQESNLPLITLDQTRAYIGNGIKNLMLQASSGQGDIEVLLKCFKEYYQNHYLCYTAPYPYIDKLLTYYKDKGIILGVLTNKVEDIAQKIIQGLFKDTFDFVYGEVKNRNRKPDPSFLLAIIKECHLKKEDVLYVGDSEVDILTCRNAGIDGAFVSYGFRDEKELLSLSSKVFSTPLELMEFIGD